MLNNSHCNPFMLQVVALLTSLTMISTLENVMSTYVDMGTWDRDVRTCDKDMRSMGHEDKRT